MAVRVISRPASSGRVCNHSGSFQPWASSSHSSDRWKLERSTTLDGFQMMAHLRRPGRLSERAGTGTMCTRQAQQARLAQTRPNRKPPTMSVVQWALRMKRS